ncbi:MAG: hypothetical protein IKT63_00170 [Oscillospiraceae bacterium]|nr:hypothetical protein [Oscillospiraceae bacterium]
MIRYDILIISLVVIAVISVVLDIITKKQYRKEMVVFGVLSAMVIVSSFMLMKYDNIGGDDQYFHAYRILGIAEGISRGVPFTKINFAFNNGYGYIEPVFYPRMFMWIPGILVALGMNISNAYKILLLIINILTVTVSYKSFKAISGDEKIAVAVTAIYTLNLYRLADIYIRAAVGELLFMAFLPMIVYGVYSVFNGHSEKWYILTLAATFILQSHILGAAMTAVIGLIIISGYAVRNICKRYGIKKEMIALFKAAAATAVLNIAFLARMLYYMGQDFRLFDYEPEKFVIYLQPVSNLFFKTDNFDRTTIYSYMGPVIGLMLIAVIIMIALGCIKSRKISDEIFWGILSIVCIVLISPAVPWEQLSDTFIGRIVMGNMQFSFRFVAIFMIVFSMTVVHVLKRTQNTISKVSVWIITVSMVFAALLYYGLSYEGISVIEGYDGEYVLQNRYPTEYFMNGVDGLESENEDKLRTSTDNITIIDHEYYKAGSRVTVSNSSQNDESIEVPLFYYDGYNAYSVENGIDLPVFPGEYGVVRVIVPSYVNGEIIIQFRSKVFLRITDMISVMSVAAAAVYCVIRLKKQK